MAAKSYNLKSSNLKSMTYDPKEQELHVTFHNGSTYKYVGIAPKIAWALRRNKSAGKTFNRRVRQGGFQYEKIAFVRGFFDGLEKAAVSSEWIARKLGQDPDRFKTHSNIPSYIQAGWDPFAAENPTGFDPSNKSTKAERGNLVRDFGLSSAFAVPGHSVHMLRPSLIKEVLDARGRPNVARPNFRELTAHELFHRDSPVLPRSETLASIYGGMKRKGAWGRLGNTAVRALTYGIPKDLAHAGSGAVRKAYNMAARVRQKIRGE